MMRLVRERGHPVPAIAMTAYARREDSERVLDSGYQAHVPKPVDPARLVETVRTLVHGRAPA
jgi:CheY-like chemotaxis protein